jgi:hypothetical protein
MPHSEFGMSQNSDRGLRKYCGAQEVLNDLNDE